MRNIILRFRSATTGRKVGVLKGYFVTFFFFFLRGAGFISLYRKDSVWKAEFGPQRKKYSEVLIWIKKALFWEKINRHVPSYC